MRKSTRDSMRNTIRESIGDKTRVSEIQPESQKKKQPGIQPDSMRNTTREEGIYDQRVKEKYNQRVPGCVSLVVFLLDSLVICSFYSDCISHRIWLYFS